MATFSPRLSALDAAFLYFERPNQRMQVGCVVELEAPIAYQELVAAVTERLAAIARYRQRPVRATFDLDRPAWEDDPGFDVERHVHHVALPAPGGPQELHALVDALFEAPLDPDHPLWEVHLIDGLAGGRAAMLWKVHHCMVDGVSGAQILTLVTDGAGRDASAAPPVAGCGRAVARTDETAIGLLASVARALRPSAALQLARDVGTALGTIRRMVTEPNTVLPFNGPLSGRRHVVWTSLALDDVMAVRAHAGCKVNDVVLAIIADALHRYVEARGVRSAEARVRAIVPVSVRGDGERLAMGNLVTALLPTLPIGPATPLDRLRRVAGEMAAMKENGELRAAGLVLALAGALPAPLEAVLGRFAPDTPIANTVCTNVPGPRDERSVLGRRILAIHPIVPLFQGMGLEFAVMSYAGRLSIAAVADGALVPDPQAIADAVSQAASDLTLACREAEERSRTDAQHETEGVSQPGSADRAPSVADLMSRGVATLRRGDSLLFAYRTMVRLGIRHLPVLDDDDRIVGIVSHRDLLAAQTSSLAAIAPEARVRALARREADEVMETHVTVAFDDEPAADAALRMMRRKIGCVPVLSRTGRLVGIVTPEDYLRWATAKMAPAGTPSSPSAASSAPAHASDMSFCASQGSPWVPRNAVPAAGSTTAAVIHSTSS